MIRVYVAGAYSANNVVAVLLNIRRGIRASTELFMDGYAPFCPWFDMHFILAAQENEEKAVTDKKKFYDYCLVFVDVCQAMLVISDAPGVRDEEARARELGIPIFYNKRDLDEWRLNGEFNNEEFGNEK